MQPQVAIVTGTSSGFGRLISLTLAREGFLVFATMRELHGRNAPAARDLLRLAAGSQGELRVLELDVTSDRSVNNAGFGYGGITETFTIAQMQKIFDTNVFGVMRTIRAVLPQMHQQRSGLLIQISSGAGRVVLPGMGLYCASKFALEALTEAFHYDLAPSGIGSISIAPGAYPTGIAEKIGAGDDPERIAPYGAVREVPDRLLKQI